MNIQDAIITGLEDEYGVSYDDVQPEADLCCGQEVCIDVYKADLEAEFKAYKETK